MNGNMNPLNAAAMPRRRAGLLSRAAIALAALLFTLACGGGKDAAVPVTSVTISQKTASLVVGDTLQLAATVQPSNASNRALAWESSLTSVATVSGSGLVRAAGPGPTTIITVKSVSDPGVTDTCAVDVAAPTEPPTITQHPQRRLATSGQSVTFTAEAGPRDPDLRWQKSTDGGRTWADTPTLATGPLTLANDGDMYRMVATNLAGSTASDPAKLTVFAPTTVSTGGSNSHALKADGGLWGWGDNDKGTVGDGTRATKREPVRIGAATDWVSVSTGSHALALKADGSLWGWGYNYFGQVGVGTTSEAVVAPVRIGTASDWAVARAGSSSIALKSDGSLWVWGYNRGGCLGDGTETDRHEPTRLGADTDWAAVAAGWCFLALKADGTLWSWGYNWYGCLGDGSANDTVRQQPTRITGSSDWAAVAACSAHSNALKLDGALWYWGESPEAYGGTVPVPTRMGSLTGWTAVSGSHTHSLAIRSDGELWAWGRNTYGQLGNGTVQEWGVTTDPIRVGTGTVLAVAGVGHSMALKSDGTLWTWGLNDMYQLGDGTRTNRREPVQIGTGFRVPR